MSVQFVGAIVCTVKCEKCGYMETFRLEYKDLEWNTIDVALELAMDEAAWDGDYCPDCYGFVEEDGINGPQ